MAFVKRKKESKISREFLEKEMDLCLVESMGGDGNFITPKKHEISVKNCEIIDGKIKILFIVNHLERGDYNWGNNNFIYKKIKFF